MKYLMLTLALFTSVALAVPANWVRIGDDINISNGAGKAETQTQVFLDTANPILDSDGFKGYTIRWILPAPANGVHVDATPYTYQIVETIVEYNCATNVSRGKRTFFMTLEGMIVDIVPDGWRVLAPGSGAAAMIGAVQTRA